MKNILKWMENSFAPKMNKINHNTWVVVLKDSINQTMPLIFLGSVFSMLSIPGSAFHWTWWPDFGGIPAQFTMGIISLMIAFLLPFNLMEKSRLKRSRIVAGISGVILFGMTITPQLMHDNAIGFNHKSFGPGGMFVAIVTGVIAGLIIRTFGKFSFFSDESPIPDFVRAWFDQMLPLATVLVIGWVTVFIAKFDLYHAVQSFFSPLGTYSEVFWGFLLLDLIVVVFYSMGISGWVLTPLTTPIKLAAIQANMDAVAAGNPAAATHVFTQSFQYAYMGIGGIGCTLALAIMLCFSRSQKLKALGKAVIVPSIFNINEPVVFGAIAWNPIMMIPFWLCSIAYTSIAWIFTKVIAFAPIPTINFQLWYTPFPISAWLSTGAGAAAIKAVILGLIIFAATALIWYPFFKVYERQCVAEETGAEELAAA